VTQTYRICSNGAARTDVRLRGGGESLHDGRNFCVVYKNVTKMRRSELDLGIPSRAMNASGDEGEDDEGGGRMIEDGGEDEEEMRR